MTLTGREREPCARPTMPPRGRIIAPPLPALQSPRPPPAAEALGRGSAIPLRLCWQDGHTRLDGHLMQAIAAGALVGIWPGPVTAERAARLPTPRPHPPS